jgi:hypothetical protein
MDGSLPKKCPAVQPFDLDGPLSRTLLNMGPYWKFIYKSSPQEPVGQLQPNFAEMILGWSPSKIVSGISDIRPRWPSQSNLN